VKAVLLDLDDTLLDYSGGAEQCWAQACAAGASALDQTLLLAELGTVRRWFWSDPERHRRERIDMMRAWTTIVAHALERCGAADPGRAAAVAEDFATRRRAIMTLFPEAHDVLRALRARGLPLALVTNGDAREQRAKIERHALAPFFDAILIEGEMGVGKPEAVVYRRALEALGVQAGPEVWMVGDHLEFDVAGSQRAGLRAAWIDRPGAGLPPGSAAQPDRILRTLDQLTRATVAP
jgi:putative hydrolase of the HAD superfamily